MLQATVQSLLARMYTAGVLPSVMGVLGILLFGSGMFLTRSTLPLESTCTGMEQLLQDGPKHVLPLLGAANDAMVSKDTRGVVSCNFIPNHNTYKRVIVIIIDALGFDFVIPSRHEHVSASDVEYGQVGSSAGTAPVGMSSMLARLGNPHQAALFRFVADPPTTTMQRLKALATGGMPTFLSMKDNFAADAVNEDSWVRQFQRRNERASAHGQSVRSVFMGDDTWMSLFPDAFDVAHPFPSFNVKDLDTVDNGVIQHLLAETNQTQFSHQLVLAHFLGLDHAGHRYHARHAALWAKLRQLDAELERLFRAVEHSEEAKDTIVFVLGDHGMTLDGNHGGATAAETDATLFAWSPRGAFSWSPPASPHDPRAYPYVSQIDFVPSVCLLAGLPIPFGNLGSFIPTLLPAASGRSALVALRLNSLQVWRFLRTYQQRSGQSFPEQELMRLSELLHRAEEMYTTSSTLRDDALVARAFALFLHKAAGVCKAQWVEFSAVKMLLGLSVVVACAVHVVRPLLQVHASLDMAVSLLFALGYLQGLFSNSFIANEAGVVWFLLSSLVVYAALVSMGLRVRAAVDGRSALLRLRSDIWCLLASIAALALLNPTGANAMDPLEGLSFDRSGFASVVAFWLLALALLSWLYQLPLSLPLRLVACVAVTTAVWSTQLFWLLHVQGARSASLADNVRFLPRWTFVVGAALMVWSVTTGAFRFHSLQRQRMMLCGSVLSLVPLCGPRFPVILVVAAALAALYVRSSAVVCPGFSTADTVVWCLLTVLLFFLSGHDNSVSSLQITAAYVGFHTFSYWRCGLMLFANTFGCHWLAIHTLPLLVHAKMPTKPMDAKQVDMETAQLFALRCVVASFGVRCALTTVNLWLQRRHLMVWDIFAPKFLFDSCSQVAILVAAAVAAGVTPRTRDAKTVRVVNKVL